MRLFRCLSVVLLAVSGHGVALAAEKAPLSSVPAAPLTDANHQLVLVRSPTWFAQSAVLERFERDQAGKWTSAGASTPVNIGRNGMAWGRGLNELPKEGPRKTEGDGKSPAGAFVLSRAFGVAEALPPGAHGFPYLHSSASTYCVEDTRSRYYNQIIDAAEVQRSAWEKWSELRRADGLFDWGVIVKQNEPDVRKSAGSCVFLHVWRGAHLPTAGCTAMPRDQIEAVVRWLEAGAQPVLVQLPEAVFQQLRGAWHLP